MQDYIIFLILGMLFFAIDMLIYCAINYQITYTLLFFYSILVIKKNNFLKITFIFFLLSIQSWFIYNHSLLALIHLPLTYLIWYRHHDYLYFNTYLFTLMAIANFLIQLLIEYIILGNHFYHYIYYKIGGILIVILYSIHSVNSYNIAKANKRK